MATLSDRGASSSSSPAPEERLRELGSIAAQFAHELNNLLLPILGYAEMLLRCRELSPDMRRQLTLIESAAKDAALLVGRLLDSVRSSPREHATHWVDLTALARQVREWTRLKWFNDSLRSGRMIEFRLELEPSLLIRGDATELREVVANFVINAVDAMPRGGTITLRNGSSGGRVLVACHDTGIGMDEPTRSRLFQPFFTTKAKAGCGLGLSISYAIAKRHGGDITVESEPGQGSTFTLWLPLAQ